MLKTIIQAIETATSLDMVPFYATTDDEQIIYTCSPSQDNGAVSQRTLELRLITNNMTTAEAKRKLILNKMVTVGDKPSTISGLLKCELTGGGQLQDPVTKQIQTIMYLQLTTRSEV